MRDLTHFICGRCNQSFYGTRGVAESGVCMRCTRDGVKMFKKGDKVKCVDAPYMHPGELEVGHNYTVADVGTVYPTLEEIDGGWYPKRFVLADAPTQDATPAPVTFANGSTMNVTPSGDPLRGSGTFVTRAADGSVGVKHSKGKLQFRLILPEFEEAMAAVLTKGAVKYPDPKNWQNNPRWMYEDALLRHTNALRKGEIMDDGPEGTGQPHTACIAVNAMFISWFDSQAGNQ